MSKCLWKDTNILSIADNETPWVHYAQQAVYLYDNKLYEAYSHNMSIEWRVVISRRVQY